MAVQNDFAEEEQETFVLSVYLLCLPEGVTDGFPPPQERGKDTATRANVAFQGRT